MGRKKKVLTPEELAEKERLEKEKEARRQERIARQKAKLEKEERKQIEREIKRKEKEAKRKAQEEEAKRKHEEHLQWLQLCEYVKTEIMKYDENQKLTNYMINRLLGLRKGQKYANNKQQTFANYSYEVILNTFEYCKHHEFDYILDTIPFNNDEHKFNYVLNVVDRNINMIYNKMKKKQEQEKKLETITAPDLPNFENKYVTKDSPTIKKELI